MRTSGSGAVNAVLYLLTLVASMLAARDVLGDLGPWLRRPRPVAVGLWSVVAAGSLVGLAVPAVLDALSRRPDLVRSGQWWRLLTSAVVQDGGVAGTAFNLVELALIAILAAHLWGPVRTVGLFVAGVLVLNLPAVYLSPSSGAGNSGATFFLATSVVGLVLWRRREMRVAAAAGLTVVAGVVLLVLRDAHGEPVLAGLLAGVLLAAVAPGGRSRGEEAGSW